jgi:glycosyltransferase involved in cell wall biosynthesis
MRIALFFNVPSGGAKRTIYESTKRLSAHHQIDVYTLTTANHEFADIRPFVQAYRVFEYHPARLLSSPFGRLNQALRLSDLRRMDQLSKLVAKAIDDGSYDLAYVHPCQITQSPMVLKHLNKLPTVYYLHEPPRAIYESRPVRPYYKNNSRDWRSFIDAVDPLLHVYNYSIQKVDLQNTRRTKNVLVNSKYVRDLIRNIYQVEANLCYHGVDIEKFRPIETEKQNMILSVGSLTPLKGFDFLLQSIAYLPDELRPLVVIASNFQMPEEKKYLEDLAIRLKVKLQIQNNVSDKELLIYYNMAKITAYTPFREPFGLVPLESMACGTPVVAVKEGGVQETILHDQTGLLVERDPLKFSEALQRLLSNQNLRIEYGQNGREHVLENWTWENAIVVLDEYLTTFAGVIRN